MTTSVNPTLSTAEQVFYDLIWAPLVQMGITYLQGVAPFLNLPVVASLFSSLVTAITTAVFNQLVLVIDVTAIQFLNAEHQAAYTEASEQLVIIGQEQGVTSVTYIEAQKAALIALSKFTNLSGV